MHVDDDLTQIGQVSGMPGGAGDEAAILRFYSSLVVY